MPKIRIICPYPEKIVDYTGSDEVISNPLYRCWHEGYEAHKLEVLELASSLESFANELKAEIQKVKELKSQLEERKCQSR